MIKNKLTSKQDNFLKEFFSIPKTKVVYDKKQRKSYEKRFSNERTFSDDDLKNICPAFYEKIITALEKNKNLQSAVFSECSYSQTLANMYGLNKFCVINEIDDNRINSDLRKVLRELSIKPRYLYQSKGQIQLVQAGGPGGIDAVFYNINSKSYILIEFKEPYCKTTEADLPFYKKLGYINIDRKFTEKHPNYVPMVKEQIKKKLNFFEKKGSNINDFSKTSLKYAVLKNYVNEKKADFICVEDKNSYLSLIPINDIDIWAELEGEIRPCGRNYYRVWSVNKLDDFISKSGGMKQNGFIKLPSNVVETSSARGNLNKDNRKKFYKIFFSKSIDVVKDGDYYVFKQDKIKQLKPTIAAKLNFKKLDYDFLKDFYCK